MSGMYSNLRLSRGDLRQGVLIIAHGSRNPNWVKQIDRLCRRVRSPIPMVISYLELVEERSIAEGVQKLEQQGVQDIIVVPLFVCSGSTHLAEIQYILGINRRCVRPTDVPRVRTNARIQWCPPIDDHPNLVSILRQRLGQVMQSSHQPVLLVAHGSDKAHWLTKWQTVLASIVRQLKKETGLEHVSYATLLPDQLPSKIRSLEEVNQEAPMVVLPLFIAEGYFTSHVIPSRLQSVRYVRGRAILPHPLISLWIEDQIQARLTSSVEKLKIN
ncbi:sirohydrochlorin chelatase [Caldalkalibacillus salinus]|uniref:sirohydrochlorin chelatase n=1 Tax=Caldalkalibacillus salinus TaxID=2803787 RepID=UPI0019228782|nr:CbiX/SirB N-terminal domain-containing protein [Caldalkalibacillus salinus]